MHIAGLLIGIALLMYLTYKGLDAMTTTLLAAVIILLTNGVGLWEGLSTGYAVGFAGFIQDYIWVIIPGALFGQIMSETRCAESVAYKISSVVGVHRAIAAVVIISAVLTYGGISGFVVVFTVYPIQKILFKNAGLPRGLLQATVLVGAVSGSSLLPYSPEIYNIMPTQYLGTTVASAPVFGIAISLFCLVINMLYMTIQEKRHFAKVGQTIKNEEVMKEIKEKQKEIPSFWVSFMPFILVIGSMVALTGRADAMAVVFVSLLLGCASALLAVFRTQHERFLSIVKEGIKNGGNSLITVSAVIGFSAVVTMVPAFKEFISWILSLKINPYISEVTGVGLISGITGSGTAGMKIFFESLGEHYLNMGANPGALHRLSQVAGMGLNTLPHSPGIVIGLTYMGLSYKESYKHTFFVSVLVPVVASYLFAIIAMLIY